MPSGVDRDTVTSSAIVAPDGIVVMVTHTVKVDSLSAMVAMVGTTNIAAAMVALGYDNHTLHKCETTEERKKLTCAIQSRYG